MKVKAYGPNHITTYLITLNNHKILLDFNCDDISEDDICEVDYIFLSHEHLDHFESLVKYEVVSKLKDSVRLFATKTTKELIKYIATSRINSIGYNTKAKNLINKLVDSIEEVFFNEKIELVDGISFYLYRSGHTFGSSSVHLIGEYSLLYTGDIDYVKRNPSRQYNYPYHMNIDYMIVDGTRLFVSEYKGVSVNQVVDYIKRKKNQTEFKYNVRPEKAVFYAQALAEKMDDYVFVYSKQMGWYLEIIKSNGYNPYITNKVVFESNILFVENEHPKRIILVNDNTSYNLDWKLSLHITKNELMDIINNHIANEPIVLVGHYDIENSNESIDYLSQYIILKKGDNNIG